MDKRRWWMAVVVLGAVSLLGCSKKTDTSTPDAGKVGGTSGTSGTTSSTAGKSGGGAAGTATGTAGMMGATTLNVPCGDNMCAGSAPSAASMSLGPMFTLANPCCLDAPSGKCGSVQTDMSCLGSPPPAPKCPALFMGVLAGCCATGNLCGIDATLMGRGCVDLMTVSAMIPAAFRDRLMIPNPLYCDGTPVPVPDAGTGADAGE
jgi:hypothetical protein